MAHGKHKHSHAPDNRDEHMLRLATYITIFFMIVEVIGGIYSRSLILIADAGHMLIDASALILALYAMNTAKKPSDPKRSYGYKRGQVIAAFVNSLTLLGTTLWIIIESVKRFFQPEPISGDLVIMFGCLGLVVNGFSAYLLMKGSKDNINIKSALVHVIGDLLGYVAAIVTGIVVYYTQWVQIDPILSLIFALFMIKSAWAIARDSVHILMEGTPYNVDISDICKVTKQDIKAIKDMHHVHVWSLSEESLLLTAHIRVEIIDKNTHNIVKQLKTLLKEKYYITHATIEVEEENCSDYEVEALPHA